MFPIVLTSLLKIGAIISFDETMLPLLLCLILIGSAACSKERYLESGNYYFNQEIYPQAIRYYSKYLKAAGHLEKRTQARLSLARSWAKLGQCDKAAEFYEQAAWDDPFGPGSRSAQTEILNCQEYFPLAAGLTWKEGDSGSKGKNMLAVYEMQSQRGTYIVRRRLYAGLGSSRAVREITFFYRKEPGELWERPLGSSEETLVLRYPYEKGAAWSAHREGRRLRRQIVERNVSVRVAAGEFHNCIQINERQEGVPSGASIYDTYCPGAGRVLSAFGEGKSQKPQIELLSPPSMAQILKK